MYKAGDVLRDRYVIRGVLGHGGSGCVYLAEDFGVGKLWALKEIGMDDYGSRHFAESEIQMLKALDHHCFPRITDAWQDNTHFFIVSDYIEGISLGRLLEDGPLSKIKTYKFAYQIAEAIEYLHLNNPPILFLDLKPDNIMLKPDGRIYLIDFGISAFLTGLCGGYGTKGFAPPEQYGRAGKTRLDERADVYAFGRTYFAMRTGRYPDDMAGNSIENVQGITSLSKSEKKFISKCTHSDVEKRIKSMHHVKKHLDHINHYSSNLKHRSVFLMVVFLAAFLIVFAMKDNKKDHTAEMLEKASAYYVEGSYSPEGLAIIENYINAGLLNPKEEGYYCFIVGRTYFEVIGDYREAERYFERINEEEYPEKKYYLEMCNLETGFEYDPDKIYESLSDFRDGIMQKAYSEEKYENLLFAAFCFEHYCIKRGGKNEADRIYGFIMDSIDSEAADKGKLWAVKVKNTTMERRELLNER